MENPEPAICPAPAARSVAKARCPARCAANFRCRARSARPPEIQRPRSRKAPCPHRRQAQSALRSALATLRRPWNRTARIVASRRWIARLPRRSAPRQVCRAPFSLNPSRLRRARELLQEPKPPTRPGRSLFPRRWMPPDVAPAKSRKARSKNFPRLLLRQVPPSR